MNSTLGGAMKVMVKLIRCALLGLLSPILVMAQQAGDYRSAASGSWSETTTWEVFDGTTWGAATNVPTGSEQITVRHTVTVDVPVSVSGYLKVESGGELTIGSGSLVFGAGSVYEHARDGGSVPLAEWGEGSTVVFSGITANAPANRGQDYYHVVLNTPGLTANRDLALQGRRIRGDIQVVNTGSGRWQMVGGVSDTVWVMGDVIVEEGQFTVQGTSSPTHVVVKHYGSIRVSGGNFSIARGSQGGTGTTTWYLYEGDFEMSNARTQNSNPTPGNARFVFAKAGRQRLVLGEGNTLDNLPIEVLGGTTLEVGTSELKGNGIFFLNSGATLATAHPNGVAGSIQTTGTIALDTTANFVFNGTEPQETSTLMPTVVNDLVIDNEAGVKLSQSTTINGMLRLVAGEFDNTIPFTLGPNGTISYEGGRLKLPFPPVATERTAEVPTQFALHAVYPNPFSSKAYISYDVAELRRVVIRIYDGTGKEVAELVNRDHQPGTYRIVWQAEGLASGLYYCRLEAGAFRAIRTLIVIK